MYKALPNNQLYYNWNNIFQAQNIQYDTIDLSLLNNRIERIKNEQYFFHLANIDNGIFHATVKYFFNIGAQRTNVPLTTRMISSPWEVYAGQTLNYTTDTLPIEIPEWFWSNKRIFLAESSQFYLELQLLINGLDQVFSIYNSFRKEKSDTTHLSEFQHIEYEWKIDWEKNIEIFTQLFEYIWSYLCIHHKTDILYFISEEEFECKNTIISHWPIRINFKDALEILHTETHDEKYKVLSLQYFWAWEEIKLTELLWGNVIVEKFPMLQIPFYHAIAKETVDWVPLAQNADFILYWFRETIWAGERIRDKETLLKKADIFHLPKEDYLPYVQSRDFHDYTTTSWFGLWWQRLVQWITNQPYIYEATIFPRTHLIPNP